MGLRNYGKKARRDERHSAGGGVVVLSAFLCGVLIIGGIARAYAEEGNTAYLGGGSHKGAEGNGQPIVLELDPTKQRLPAIKLKPGRYKVSTHLHAAGAHAVQLSLLEEKGGFKRIELLEQTSREPKPEDISAEMTTILMGRYELQYRLRGEDISGEVVIQRVGEPPTGVDGFGGMFLGEIRRVEQISTRRIPPSIPRKERISGSIREQQGIVYVELEGGTLDTISLKGPVLIGSRTEKGSEQEGMAGCEKHETVIFQKKDKKTFLLRLMGRYSCDDATSVWQELSGSVMRE